MLIPLTVDVDVLPDKSWQVLLTDCPAPCDDRVVGPGGLPAASPDSESAHWKLTVTPELFHPMPFAVGARELVMLGGVLSSLIVIALDVSTFPALSVPKNVIVVIPSALTVNDAKLAGSVVLGMACAPLAAYTICLTPVPPSSPSVEFRVTVTVVLFQPAALARGDATAVVSGGTVSDVTVGGSIAIGFPMVGEREGSLPYALKTGPLEPRATARK